MVTSFLLKQTSIELLLCGDDHTQHWDFKRDCQLSVLNPRDLSNYLTPTAQTEQKMVHLAHRMVTGAFVLPQGNGKLRTELPTLRLVHTHSWYTTYNLLLVFALSIIYSQYLLPTKHCLERKFPKLRPLASQSGNSTAYFLYLIQLSSASRQQLQDLLTHEKGNPPPPPQTPLFCLLESCAPAMPLLCKTCVIWGK